MPEGQPSVVYSTGDERIRFSVDDPEDNLTPEEKELFEEDYGNDGSLQREDSFVTNEESIWDVTAFQSMTNETLRLLKLLLWKNLWIQSIRRHYIITAIQLVLPLTFTLIFAIINASFELHGPEKANITLYAPLHEKDLMRHFYEEIECPRCLIAYAPESEYTDVVIRKMRNLLSGYIPEAENSTTVWKGFNSDLEIEADWQLHVQSGNISFKAAIVFHGDYSYTVRIPELSDEIDLITGTYRAPQQDPSDPYPKTASALQILIDKVLTDQITLDGFPEEKILLQAFPRLPTPLTNSQTIGKYFNVLFPMLLSLGFIFIVPSVVGAVVREKESGMRELIRANGLSRAVNWAGWMLTSIILVWFTIIFVCVLLFSPFSPEMGGIVKDGGLRIYWTLLLVLFGAAATSWCVLVSSIFDHMTLAVSTGMYIWVTSYALWASTLLYQLDISWKYVFSIFPNLALTFAAEILLELDDTQTNTGESVVTDELKASFTIFAVEMFIFSFVYFVLALYLESVLPTQFGASKPWNFFFYAAVKAFRRTILNRGCNSNPVLHPPPYAVVRTSKLRKVFADKTIDCDSVGFEASETTVIFGENGAGKSTVLSMLAGLQGPTEGTAYINGYDIRTSPLARKRVGYCPQRNTFWNDLTVGEHLWFFQMLHNCDRRPWTHFNPLVKVRNRFPITLSGGQQRLLNFSFAASGEAHVLLLDEPMTGVDMSCSDHMRSFFKQLNAANVAVIMTSHVVSDGKHCRVATFFKGKLRMVKKSRFLDYRTLLRDVSIATVYEPSEQSGHATSALPVRTETLIVCTPIALRERLWKQFFALIRKRRLQTWRDKRLLIIQLIVPLLIAILSILGGNQIRDRYSSTNDASRIEIEAYESLVTLYSTSYSDQIFAEKSEGIFVSLVPNGAEKVNNITVNLMQIAVDDSKGYRDHYIFAAALDTSGVKAMFSSTRPESAFMALNIAANYILRTKMHDNCPSIEFSLSPLTNKVPADLDAAHPTPTFVTRVALVVVATLPIGLAILAASFVVVPLTERVSKTKHLQLMTGLHVLVYWGSSFAWDMVLMMVASVSFTFFIVLIASYDTFVDKTAAGVLTLMLLVYGFAVISSSYLVSNVSRKLSNATLGFTLVMTFHFISGTIGTIVVYSLEMLSSAHIARVVSYFLSALPSFAISWSILRFTEIAALNSRCQVIHGTLLEHLCDRNNAFDLRYRSCCPWCKKYSDAPCFEPQPYLQYFSTRSLSNIRVEGIGIGLEIVIMLAVGCVCLLWLAAIECRLFKLVAQNTTAGNASESCSPPGLRAKNISKSYSSKDAISEVNLEVKPGDLCVLAGPNGAGKSTILRILTGEEAPSQGSVHIGKVNLENNFMGFGFLSKKYLSQVGYCPQQGGLIETLTTREHLRLFANLWDIHQQMGQEDIVDYWVNELGLQRVKDIQCRLLTVGMKRRVSVAIALIGIPPVVVLDEPTAGVDPQGQRRLLNVFKRLKDSRQSSIASTHNFDGYINLCSSFGIMFDGKMKEYGYVADVKQSYLEIIYERTANKPGDDREDHLMCRVLAARYRHAVDKIGLSSYIPGERGRMWLSLRSMGNKEEMKNVQQSILNHWLFHANENEPRRGLPVLAGMEEENMLARVFSYLSTAFPDYSEDYNHYRFTDIEPKHSVTMNGQLRTTAPTGNYSLAQHREGFKYKFDETFWTKKISKAKFQFPSDAERQDWLEKHSEGYVPLFSVRTFRDYWKPFLQHQAGGLVESCIGENPGRLHGHVHTAYVSKAKTSSNSGWGPIHLAVGHENGMVRLEYVCLAIDCLPIENERFLLSGSFMHDNDKYYTEKIREDEEYGQTIAEAVLDLPNSPDAWSAGIVPLAEQFETFIEHGRHVARIRVPPGPLPEVQVEILELYGLADTRPKGVQTRSITDHVFRGWSFQFQCHYIQPLLKQLNKPSKCDCVALVDIENFLNVSLRKTKAEGNIDDEVVGSTSNEVSKEMEPSEHSPRRQKLIPPAKIFAEAREIFHECGSFPITGKFSYDIESTDLRLKVEFEVRDEGSSFKFAFVEPPADEGEASEVKERLLQSGSYQYGCGYAKEGEKIFQIRNIIASVNMTEPKDKRFVTKDYNINSQLSIRIFTV